MGYMASRSRTGGDIAGGLPEHDLVKRAVTP